MTAPHCQNRPHLRPLLQLTGQRPGRASSKIVSIACTTASDISWILHNNKYYSKELYRWDVNDAAPANASFRGERRNIFTIEGNEIDLATIAQIESDAAYFHITFTKTLQQNGNLVREKTWTDRIPRRYQ